LYTFLNTLISLQDFTEIWHTSIISHYLLTYLKIFGKDVN